MLGQNRSIMQKPGPSVHPETWHREIGMDTPENVDSTSFTPGPPVLAEGIHIFP